MQPQPPQLNRPQRRMGTRIVASGVIGMFWPGVSGLFALIGLASLLTGVWRLVVPPVQWLDGLAAVLGAALCLGLAFVISLAIDAPVTPPERK